jgi:hypothetical protein
MGKDIVRYVADEWDRPPNVEELSADGNGAEKASAGNDETLLSGQSAE